MPKQKQYRYAQNDKWHNLPPFSDWFFVVKFLPGYLGRGDVDVSYGIQSVIHKEPRKTLQWLYKSYPELVGKSWNEILDYHNKNNRKLFREAKKYFKQALESGKIEMREKTQ